MTPMRYDTAVRRLRIIAESCERPNRLTDSPILVAAYVAAVSGVLLYFNFRISRLLKMV